MKDKGSMLPSFPLPGVHDVTLRDNVRSCEICKALNVEPRLRIERSQVHWFAMCPESPSDDWLGKSCWLNHGKAAKSSPKYQVE